MRRRYRTGDSRSSQASRGRLVLRGAAAARRRWHVWSRGRIVPTSGSYSSALSPKLISDRVFLEEDGAQAIVRAAETRSERLALGLRVRAQDGTPAEGPVTARRRPPSTPLPTFLRSSSAARARNSRVIGRLASGVRRPMIPSRRSSAGQVGRRSEDGERCRATIVNASKRSRWPRRAFDASSRRLHTSCSRSMPTAVLAI